MAHLKLLHGIHIFLLCITVQGAASSTIFLTSTTTYTDGSVRGLAGVSHGGQSGYICGTSSDPKLADAQVICHQYGYGMASITYTSLSGSDLVLLKDPGCRGNENDIMQCANSTVGSYNSDCQQKGYSVTCSRPYVTANATIQLVGAANQGIVEVKDNTTGSWKRVCNSAWGTRDAQTACIQLGYRASEIISATSVSPGANYLGIKGFDCSGKEAAIEKCEGFSYTTGTCQDNLSASVACSYPISDYVVHYGGSAVYIDGQWGKICAESMSSSEANDVGTTLCKTLGYDRRLLAYEASWSSQTPMTTNIRFIDCSNSQSNISQCDIGLAPSGKVFNCFRQLIFLCTDSKLEDEGISVWDIVGLVLRLGIPLLFFGGMGMIGLCIIMYHHCCKKKRQVSAAGTTAAPLPPPVPGHLQKSSSNSPGSGFSPPVGGPSAGGSLPPPYQTTFAGASADPFASGPGQEQPNQPPPAYSTVVNTTTGDSSEVPAAPMYQDPNNQPVTRSAFSYS